MNIKKIFLQAVCYIHIFYNIYKFLNNLLYYIENKFINVYNNRLKKYW